MIAAVVLTSASLAGEMKDIVVTAEGLAACTSGSDCRHAALADALRRAVEKAVGTFVEGDTHTKNYQLVQDTIHTTSDGFVRDYRVLDEGSADGVYRIQIEARVAPGSPEQSLGHLCRRLREEINPVFRISVDAPPEAGTEISNRLAALGLRVTADQGTSADIIIKGRVEIDALGEPVPGTKVFSAEASTELTVTDSSSDIIPCINVSLAQPAVALSQEQARKEAVRAACKLWVERNIPLISSTLLEPGKPLQIETHGDTPTELPIAKETPQIVSDGPREKIKPEAMTQLADKLKASVAEKSEFGSLPVDIAVARFKLIGVSDPTVADDILEDLSTALAKTGVFELVERSQLDKVLQELRIQNSGLIDSTTAMKLGKLIGAKAVLVGSVSDRKDCLVINARLINTESGRVRIAESVVVDKETERQPFVLKAGPGD